MDIRFPAASGSYSLVVTGVGQRAFYWCTNCTEVQLPQSLTAIREYGFNNLRSLKNITLPSDA